MLCGRYVGVVETSGGGVICAGDGGVSLGCEEEGGGHAMREEE
jgi:hypothetical protein